MVKRRRRRTTSRSGEMARTCEAILAVTQLQSLGTANKRQSIKELIWNLVDRLNSINNNGKRMINNNNNNNNNNINYYKKKKKIICKYFLRNTCKFGNNCWYTHRVYQQKKKKKNEKRKENGNENENENENENRNGNENENENENGNGNMDNIFAGISFDSSNILNNSNNNN